MDTGRPGGEGDVQTIVDQHGAPPAPGFRRLHDLPDDPEERAARQILFPHLDEVAAAVDGRLRHFEKRAAGREPPAGDEADPRAIHLRHGVLSARQNARKSTAPMPTWRRPRAEMQPRTKLLRRIARRCGIW